MANVTMLKFNYPHSLLGEYENWVVLLRPAQVTAGSLVLVCKLDAERMSEVPPAAFAELATVTGDLERVLLSLFAYDKINYLLLMMVDKNVHFHVLPRYASSREAGGITFIDQSWPRPPDLTNEVGMTVEQHSSLLAQLKRAWPINRR